MVFLYHLGKLTRVEQIPAYQEKMTNKKIISIGIVLFLCISLIVGCSSNETVDESEEADLPQSSYLPEVPRISAKALKAKMDAGSNILVIDSRSEENYNQAHIAGDITTLLWTMTEPYSELAVYTEIITYCS